ncbi:MAG TPA: OB-fold nucleic acid binding domain-containing protein [Pyrinomonadaceae bacterium]|nr:OB-fold nucleic acid binding domain-containing protein [Pyrinomonadaceae bacterium]
MSWLRKSALCSLILGVAFLLTACPSETNIGRINSDPGRYNNKEVSVTGRVTDSFGALGRGAYQIDDGTGRIWVVVKENNGVPNRGAEVGVRGRVQSGVSFGGRSFGTVIQESDRRSRGR